jgi:proline dehydrogenase
MLRSLFLYLSQQPNAKRLLVGFPPTRRLARRFVAGDRLVDAATVAARLNEAGLRASLDHLGEHVGSHAEAAVARDAYIEALSEIHQQRLQAGISVKLTQLGMDISEDECAANLRAVVDYAERTGSFVRVDMENSFYTERTLVLVSTLASKSRETQRSVGAVIQAYLYRSENDVRQLIARGISVRLCKGAYNEPSAVAFPRKADVDGNYVRLMRLLLESGIYHAVATHDAKIIDETCRFASERKLSKDSFEFQMLHGVRADLQQRLAREGYRLRIYVPYGREWFSYFMRRLAERPANVFFVLKGALHA